MTETIREKLRAGLQQQWDRCLCDTAPFNAAQWADAILNILSEPGEEDVERVARGLCEASGETWREGEIQFATGYDFATVSHSADPLNNHWRYKVRAAIKAYVSGGEG